MSMPVISISDCPVCREQAINDLIESVALEETALSHILNAEGEKLQKIIAMCNVSPHMILEANRSVKSLINSVTRLEVILQSKLDTVSCDISPE